MSDIADEIEFCLSDLREVVTRIVGEAEAKAFKKGRNEGFEEGYDEGYDVGYDVGIENAQQSGS